MIVWVMVMFTHCKSGGALERLNRSHTAGFPKRLTIDFLRQN